jgi:hypothetical protein
MMIRRFLVCVAGLIRFAGMHTIELARRRDRYLDESDDESAKYKAVAADKT